MHRDTLTPSIKVTPPGPISRRWTEYHMAHTPESIYFHDLVWDRSKPAIGPFCTDPDGNVILDFSSHGAAFPLGYNNPELIETATAAARINPDRYGAEIVAAWGQDPGAVDVPTPSHLMHKLVSLTKPYGPDAAYLSNSGAEAVDNALKVCYGYRRNMGIGFCFQGAFHGRTLGATSLTRSRRAQRAWYPHLPEIIERDGLLENATRVGGHLLRGLKDMQKRHSMIRNPRGVGLMVAMTLEGSGMASKLVQEAFSRGLLVFSCGFDSIRFMPPLDVTIREADLALEILDGAMAAL